MEDFISAIRSPLTKLTLDFLRSSGGDLKEWTSTSLSSAISHLKDSLESLSIEGSCVRLERRSLGSQVPTFTQFHTVRSLTLCQTVDLPHLPTLLELFSNLDGTFYFDRYYRDDAEDYDVFKRVREENGKAQERRRWTGLEQLISDVNTLFAFNLQCPIGLTIVHNCTAEVRSESLVFSPLWTLSTGTSHCSTHTVTETSSPEPKIAGVPPLP